MMTETQDVETPKVLGKVGDVKYKMEELAQFDIIRSS